MALAKVVPLQQNACSTIQCHFFPDFQWAAGRNESQPGWSTWDISQGAGKSIEQRLPPRCLCPIGSTPRGNSSGSSNQDYQKRCHVWQQSATCQPGNRLSSAASFLQDQMLMGISAEWGGKDAESTDWPSAHCWPEVNLAQLLRDKQLSCFPFGF